MTLRIPLALAASALLLLSGLAMALPAASAQSTVVVSMPAGAGNPSGAPGYAPDTITIVIGVNNTVVWENNDTATNHNVTPKTQPTGGNWPTAGSGNMDPGAVYSFTFTVPGTYDYVCTYHSWMTGTVVVKAATTPSPEFPAAALAVVLFAVLAAVMVAAPRLNLRLPSSV
jgi:plastocyanin